MKLEVCFTAAELEGTTLEGRVVVVIDVLRASSTIVEALANGARAVLPVATIDESVELAQKLGRDNVLLCGERRGLPIEGFDLGNSPAEFTPERVAGKTLVMTTTNGTRAVLAAGEAGRVLIASFLNLGAVATALRGLDELPLIVCAGREHRFALEDAVCAGLLAQRVGRGRMKLARNDAAQAAAALARRHARSIPALLKATDAGHALAEIGLAEDLVLCSVLDRHTVVPELRERQLVL